MWCNDRQINPISPNVSATSAFHRIVDFTIADVMKPEQRRGSLVLQFFPNVSIMKTICSTRWRDRGGKTREGESRIAEWKNNNELQRDHRESYRAPLSLSLSAGSSVDSIRDGFSLLRQIKYKLPTARGSSILTFSLGGLFTGYNVPQK